MFLKKNIILILLLAGFSAFSQNANNLIRKGNSQYNSGSYKDAEVTYRKSLEKDSNNIRAKFNLADALYKQGNYAEALKTFSSLIDSTLDKSTRAKIYHNLGNALLQSKKYEESIEAYKNALRDNPNDMDTKYNLSYALKYLQKQKQQQQQNKDNKDKKDENKDKKDDQNKNDENKDKNKQGENKQDEKKQDDKKEQEKKQQQKSNQLTKDDAQRMLDALNNKDKNLQDKLNEEKVKAVQIQVEKDW